MFSEMMVRYQMEAQRERHENLLRMAELERLVRASRPESEKRYAISGAMLAWLGRRMVAWGSRLVARYGLELERTVYHRREVSL